MKDFNIALVGNPNSGKSTLFNLLSGIRQKTGNFPGVTVDKKTGPLAKESSITVTDLPGVYDLYPSSLDEVVVLRELIKKAQTYDGLVYVAEAPHLERALLLYSQVADLGYPIIFVLNMMDETEKQGIQIDVKALQSRLGIPVLTTNARSAEGLPELESAIIKQDFREPIAFFRSQYSSAEQLNHHGGNGFRSWIKQQFQLDESAIDKAKISTVHASKESIISDLQKRKAHVQKLAAPLFQTTTKAAKNNWLSRLEDLTVHPFWGYLIFIGVLFLIFQAIFSWSAWPMDLMDALFSTASNWVKTTFGEGLLSRLVAEGIIPGIGGVLIFIPQIALLFLFISILEGSGYMARVVFLMDRLMQKFGLSGRSVVPLISGLACSIPAIMAARTIENPKERLLTILVTPFMTCSARLPVYAILITIAVPATSVLPGINLQGLVLLGLYLLGTLAAVLSAALINRFLPQTGMSHLVLAMPNYRWPNWREVVYTIWAKVKTFVWEAGKIIFVISLVLWVLASFGPNQLEQRTEDYKASIQNAQQLSEEELDKQVQAFHLENSFAGIMGKAIEPIVKPLGYDWKISIALITSFAAREVFVGTLATIYSVGEDFSDETIIQKMTSEINPATGERRFNLATALSLLIFYAFAMQCMSTLAIVKRETNSWKWPILQFIGMTVLAYLAALVVYQLF